MDFRKQQGRLFGSIFNFSHLLIRGFIKGLKDGLARFWRFGKNYLPLDYW